MFDYQFTKTSLKRFKKLPKDVQIRIVGKLDYFCAQEDPIDFAEPLARSDLGEYRFRIGDYRVSFDMEDQILVIHDVDNRKDIYR
ncbi:MAG: type II toxin-antitoxin system RelE/ParE family toxin [Candidatus Daviesbacteria bacterium]|nr:type II toxin-antitoxin system RelE/ParE family toxin [Candidatus Daviesbacteria bacterium]